MSDLTPKSRKLYLTASAIKNARPGQELRDTEVPGLQVRVRESGAAFFFYFRTKAGDERRPKLGSVDVLSIAQARELARQKLRAVAEGRDPTLEQRALRDEPTVDDLWDAVDAKHYSKKKTRREFKRLYVVHVKPRLGSRRVRSVTFDDVADLHGRLARTPYQANRVLALLSKLFNYAERPLQWRDRHSNPCSGVVPFPELKRKKFFRGEHLQRLLPILKREEGKHPREVAWIRFALFTGARPSEIEALVPPMIDGDVARLDDGKTGQRDIYLSPQAKQALHSVPWRGAKVPILGRLPRTFWRRIRDEAGLKGFWLRDTRRTFGVATLSTPHGAQAGELLGHMDAQTTKTYVALLEDSAREAAAAAARRIEELATSPAS